MLALQPSVLKEGLRQDGKGCGRAEVDERRELPDRASTVEAVSGGPGIAEPAVEKRVKREGCQGQVWAGDLKGSVDSQPGLRE